MEQLVERFDSRIERWFSVVEKEEKNRRKIKIMGINQNIYEPVICQINEKMRVILQIKQWETPSQKIDCIDLRRQFFKTDGGLWIYGKGFFIDFESFKHKVWPVLVKFMQENS